jgi:hypothetical protein
MAKLFPSAQVYPFTLLIGETRELIVSGSYFKIRSATGAVAVQLDSGAKLDPLSVGQGLRGVEFSRLTISNRTGGSNSGTIIVATTEFIDDQIFGTVAISNSPSVTVVDPTTGSGSYSNGKYTSTVFRAATAGNVSFLYFGQNNSAVAFLRRAVITTSAPAFQITADPSGVGGGTRNLSSENYSHYTGDTGYVSTWVASDINVANPSAQVFDTINCTPNLPTILDFDRSPIRLTDRELLFCTSAQNHSIRGTFLYSL